MAVFTAAQTWQCGLCHRAAYHKPEFSSFYIVSSQSVSTDVVGFLLYSTMTGRVKVQTSGWTEAVVGVLSPEEEVASCSESQAPAPSGLMTNSVEKKEKLKMTKAEQKIERKRTLYRQRLNSRNVCVFPRALAGGKGFSTMLVLEIVRAILKCWAEPRRGALKQSRS